MSSPARAALVCLLALLSACGQTGDLVLPGTQPLPVEDTAADEEDAEQ